MKVTWLASINNRIAGVREADVDVLWGRAAIDIGHEHRREAVTFGERFGARLVTLLATSGHSDRSTVHVHLAVANSVEPCPCQGILACSNAVWDTELESVGNRSSCAAIIKVSGSVDRASTLNRMDNHPFRVLGRFQVC